MNPRVEAPSRAGRFFVGRFLGRGDLPSLGEGLKPEMYDLYESRCKNALIYGFISEVDGHYFGAIEMSSIMTIDNDFCIVAREVIRKAADPSVSPNSRANGF